MGCGGGWWRDASVSPFSILHPNLSLGCLLFGKGLAPTGWHLHLSGQTWYCHGPPKKVPPIQPGKWKTFTTRKKTVEKKTFKCRHACVPLKSDIWNAYEPYLAWIGSIYGIVTDRKGKAKARKLVQSTWTEMHALWACTFIGFSQFMPQFIGFSSQPDVLFPLGSVLNIGYPSISPFTWLAIFPVLNDITRSLCPEETLR